MNMERVQHHVAFAGNHPTLILPFCRGKHREIHIKGFAIDPVSIMEIETVGTVVHLSHAAVVHVPHIAMIHLPLVAHIAHHAVTHIAVIHHATGVHAGHRLIAIFLHQRLHSHHVQHRIHRQLERALCQPLQRRQRRHADQRIRQCAGCLDRQRLDAQDRLRLVERRDRHPHLAHRQGDQIEGFTIAGIHQNFKALTH